ncbi:hypothetical protein INT47_013019 [Mucor saturninus]|uniref:Restriction of telomere capping protein 4 n=1 Tax=Mucor saturninus TaxID=64648 RepID=A0A8H7R0Q6_9FUNG|nr:hypothetical protein INT47_013019 [Mucor saturninus]
MERNTYKRRMDELSAGRNQFMSASSGSNKKPNTAMVSSFDPARNRFKGQTFRTDTTKLIKPTRVKKTSTDDSDDDFKESLILPTRHTAPISLSKPARNPFAANKASRVSKPGLVIDDTDDFRVPARAKLNLPTKLTLPKKNKAQEEIIHKKKQLLENLTAHQKQQADNKDKKVCPFCSEILFPMRTAIAEALKAIQKRDREHEERELRIKEKENATSSYSLSMITKRHIPTAEKDAFCSLHYRELVTIPEGYKKKYPTKIDFDAIPKRIQRFDEELRAIISNRINSDYRNLAETAYKEQGLTKARSAMSVMLRFEHTLPGYYGPKGSAVIFDALSSAYLKSGYFAKHLVSPQLPIEFIQQVLVPEAGFRLIRQDIMKAAIGGPPPNATDKAKQIMIESCEYGNAMFPAEEPDIEESDLVKPVYIALDEDDENDSNDDSENDDDAY